MNELTWVYGTIALIAATFAIQILTRRFDPFAPLWLFLVGYTQVYVLQAISYHDWAVGVRGVELVASANFRASWALAWFLGIYFFGPGRILARVLPTPPGGWSTAPVNLLCPALIVWGLYCATLAHRSQEEGGPASAEAALALSFPMVMLVGGVILIVTGRQMTRPRPAYAFMGVAVVALYMLLWMFNGKRSHSLVAVLVGVCSFYLPRFRRPSFPVLIATALAGMLAVGISIGWRYYATYNDGYSSYKKFFEFVSTFDPVIILESINVKEKEGKEGLHVTYETEEYGGFLLMMDTVPIKSDYDYGSNYIRVFSTYIPRIVWADKPIYGRDQWTAAWVAGSEMKRESTFTGPAIGILGATQLNGGAAGTTIVLAVVAVLLSTSYHYFRLHAGSPWVQVWWPLWYYNAWFMTVNDDPCNWFYYNFGFTTLPPLVCFWWINKSFEGGTA